MKFGLLLPNYGPTASGPMIINAAQQAESLGFDSVWTTDHILVPETQAVPYGTLIETLIALQLAASVTTRVQLGTSIVVTPMRDPILLAKQLAAIDVLSGGRLIFGSGVGWMKPEFDYLGVDYHNRGKRFDEGLRLIRALWAGEKSFNGEFNAFEGALFGPAPVNPKVPLWIGGASPSAIERAAAIGDAWHPVGITPQALRQGAQQLRAISSQSGTAAGHPPLVTLRINAHFAGMGGIGTQISHESLAGQYLLEGSPADFTARITELKDAGLEYLVVWFFHADWAELKLSLTQFAEQVMPSFR
jgi:probable F420-dependent oxidoreductase